MMRVPVLAGRRAEIVDALRAHPGLSRRALASLLNAREASLSYHLHVLLKERIVLIEPAGRSCAHFVNGTIPPRERRLLLLTSEAREVLAMLTATPGTLRCCDVAHRLGISQGRVRSGLEALERLRLVRRSAYGKWEAA
jgi:DNA-binding IclR family transcriptional regulator